MSEREQQLMAAVLPQANFEAGRLAAEALMHQLAQKLAANMVLASDLQDARHKVANLLAQRTTFDPWMRANGWDGVQNREDWIAQAFQRRADLLQASDKDRLELLAFANGVRHVLDCGHMPSFEALPSELKDTLAHVDRKVREADSKAEPATVDWGVITRLRAVMGHLRGSRYPSAISLLDSVIDELTSEIEPTRSPENSRELAEATAADRKIKEDKEDRPF